MKEISSKKADLMLFFVAVFWGIGFPVTKLAQDVYTTSQLLFIRFFIASIVSILIFNKNLRQAGKSDIKAGVIMGIFLALGYVLQTFGLEGTTAGKSAFLTGTNVVIVPFLYWIITKRKLGRDNIIAAILMFVGIVFLTVDFSNFGKFNTADFLTFLCAICFAFQIVSTGYFAKDKDPYTISAIQNITCTIVFFVMMMVENKEILINSKGVLSILYLGIIGTFVCFLMQTLGQKYTSTTHAAIILSLEAVAGSIFGILFLHEVYTISSIISFILIFISILIAEIGLEDLLKKINKNIIKK